MLGRCIQYDSIRRYPAGNRVAGRNLGERRNLKPQTATIKVLSSDTGNYPLNFRKQWRSQRLLISWIFPPIATHSRSEIVRHKMVVEDGSGKTFTIACTVDTMFSKCASLPVGTKARAQWTKHGLAVWYPNAKGREVKQVFKSAASARKPLQLHPIRKTKPIDCRSGRIPYRCWGCVAAYGGHPGGCNKFSPRI